MSRAWQSRNDSSNTSLQQLRAAAEAHLERDSITMENGLGKDIIFLDFGTICGFRYPLGILEHIPKYNEGILNTLSTHLIRLNCHSCKNK